MRIFFRIYEKSMLATLCSIGGSLCAVAGFGYLMSAVPNGDAIGIIVSLLIIAAGVCAFIFSDKVNKMVVERKTKNSLEDPQLINYVRCSALAAYSLFKNNPTQAMLSYINTYNSYAANLIYQYVSRTITEEQMIYRMRVYDSNNGTINIWDMNKSSLYHNEMFDLKQIVSMADADPSLLEKLEKKKETRKTLIVLGIVAAVLVPLILLYFITKP